MYSRTFLLLQNEGYLLQGCLRSALVTLLKSSSAERGPLYAALFNYSIGLERLLKLSLILDHCIANKGALPTHAQIKAYGHDIGTLYTAAKEVAERFHVEIPEAIQCDELDESLIELLADFATSGRYFNLDALTGGGKSADPLPEWGRILAKVYERDVPPLKRASDEEQVEALADSMKATTVYMPATGFDGSAQSYEDFFADHGRITLVMRDVVWRFARILYPLQMLVFELNQPLHSGQAGNPEDFPHMWELCAFCGPDKESTLNEIAEL
jgi:hypothetical protein